MFDQPSNGMASVLVQRLGSGPEDLGGLSQLEAAGCATTLHRLRWQESFVAREGRRQVCHFHAPDAESVRLAFRQAGIPVNRIWTGTLHSGVTTGNAEFVVEYEFQPPLPVTPQEAIERAQEAFLQPQGLELARAIVSTGRAHAVLLCRLPGGVRAAPGRPGAGTARLWPCIRLQPADTGTTGPEQR